MSSSKKTKQNPNKYLVLSGIPFQMGIILFAASYLGGYLDKKYHLEKPLLTIVCILMGLVISFIILLQQLKRLR